MPEALRAFFAGFSVFSWLSPYAPLSAAVFSSPSFASLYTFITILLQNSTI